MVAIRSLICLILLLPTLALANGPPVALADLQAKIRAFETRAAASDRRVTAALDELRATVSDHEARLRALETRPVFQAQPAQSVGPYAAPACAPPACGPAYGAGYPAAPGYQPAFQAKLASHVDALLDFEMGQALVERVRSATAPPKPVVAETSTSEKLLYAVGGFVLRGALCLSSFGITCVR